MSYADPTRQQAWRDAHRESIARYNRTYTEEHREALRATARARHARNRVADALRGRANRLARYGLNHAGYSALLERQGGVCAVCRQPEPPDRNGRPRNLHIDHDHTCCPGRRSCGRCVRGLLCSRCNTALGLMEDRAEYLVQAVTYLESRP